MNNNKRLTEHQSGNKKLHSYETLNVKMTDKVLEAMNPKNLMLVVLLELSKAFDSIKHCRHLSKLEYGHLKLGAKSMFRGGSETSSLGVITHGVPQGLILALALFNLHPQSCKVAHWNHLTLSYNYF